MASRTLLEVTDDLWGEKIGRPTQQRWAAEFAAEWFVDESAGRLFRIYQYLWINSTSSGEAASVLELKIT